MRRALAVLLPVLLLAGCAPPSADDAYVSTVREGIPRLAEVPAEDLTGLGHKVCGMFDDRGFDDGMVEFIRLAKDAGITAQEAGAIAGAASGAYCPEYADNF